MFRFRNCWYSFLFQYQLGMNLKLFQNDEKISFTFAPIIYGLRVASQFVKRLIRTFIRYSKNYYSQIDQKLQFQKSWMEISHDKPFRNRSKYDLLPKCRIRILKASQRTALSQMSHARCRFHQCMWIRLFFSMTSRSEILLLNCQRLLSMHWLMVVSWMLRWILNMGCSNVQNGGILLAEKNCREDDPGVEKFWFRLWNRIWVGLFQKSFRKKGYSLHFLCFLNSNLNPCSWQNDSVSSKKFGPWTKTEPFKCLQKKYPWLQSFQSLSGSITFCCESNK